MTAKLASGRRRRKLTESQPYLVTLNSLWEVIVVRLKEPVASWTLKTTGDNSGSISGFGSGWSIKNRVFFAGDEGGGVFEVADFDLDKKTASIRSVGKSNFEGSKNGRSLLSAQEAQWPRPAPAPAPGGGMGGGGMGGMGGGGGGGWAGGGGGHRMTTTTTTTTTTLDPDAAPFGASDGMQCADVIVPEEWAEAATTKTTTVVPTQPPAEKGKCLPGFAPKKACGCEALRCVRA